MATAMAISITALLAVPGASLAVESSAVSEESMNRKLEELQSEIEVASASVENLEETIAKSVNVSGYMDAEYIIDDREGRADGFRTHHFSFFLEKKLYKKWSVFSELEFEDAPYFELGSSKEGFEFAEGKILLEQAYMDYTASPSLAFRIGRFLTPAGIWNINHYPPFVTTQSRPQHIRHIFPQYLDGFELHGSVNIQDFMVTYMGYTANGEGNPGGGDGNEEKAFGGRLEFMVPFVVEIKAGVSALSDKLNDGTAKSATGVDMQFRVRWLKIQAEYAQATLDPTEGEAYGSSGYYVQAQTDMGKFTLFARHDVFKPNDSLPDSEVVANTGGVNYHWTPTIVSKIEGNFFDSQNQDNGEAHTLWIVSLALFF